MKKLNLKKLKKGLREERKQIRYDLVEARLHHRYALCIDLNARLDVFDYLLEKGVLEEYLIKK